MLTLSHPRIEPMPINGQTASKFFEVIETAMDKAGGGKYRAFNLVAALQEVGFKIEALSPEEVPATPIRAVEAA